MGFWRTFFGMDIPSPGDPDSAPTTFDAPGVADIDPAVFGLTSYAATPTVAPRIDRRLAMQVPAVKRSHDLVAGVLGGLPLDLYDVNRQPVQPSPFAQPERNVPRSVTMTRTFADLFFDEVAWWRITETDYRGFPMWWKRLKPSSVTVDEDRRAVYVDGKEIDPKTIIRFDSPTCGLLTAGARAIRTCLLLDVAAANAADGVPPIQYFVPADGADPADDDEIAELLEAWQDVRRGRATGYVPAALKLMDGGWDPAKLQLVEQREHAVLDIARIAGIDPEELGISTTSRTYSNQFDRRKAYTDFTLGLYRQAVEDRLSMGDITPRGSFVKFNLDAFLRSDPLARYQAYAAGKAVGALDDEDIARMEDKPAGSVSVPAPPSNVTQLPTRGTA